MAPFKFGQEGAFEFAFSPTKAADERRKVKVTRHTNPKPLRASPAAKSPTKPEGDRRRVKVTRHANHKPLTNSNELRRMRAIIEENQTALESLAKERGKLRRAKEILLRKVDELEKKVKLLENALQSRVFRDGYRKSTLANNSRDNNNIAKRYQRLKARGVI